jgi:hypothetical protein
MCLLGDYRKCPQHRRKRGPGKLRNNEFATELVAYRHSSLVGPPKKKEHKPYNINIMAIQSNKTVY